MEHGSINRATSQALAAPRLPRSEFSDRSPALTPIRQLALAELDQAQAALVPADKDDFRNHLSACLTLCAPASMGVEDRAIWMRVAWATLRDVPADLLRAGSEAALRTADHPSRIVPTISKEIEGQLADRRRRLKLAQDEMARLERPRPADSTSICSPEEATAILEEFGLKSMNRPAVRPSFGAPRNPSPEDLAEIAKELGW